MSSSVPPSSLAWRFSRATTPVVRRLAGHRWLPGLAVVHHRGRRTGRKLTVPVVVVATPDVFVVNLTYGPGTNWVRNVLAAGGCVVRWKGADHPVTDPQIIGEAAARPYYPWALWVVARTMFRADAWLLLRRTDRT